MFRNVSIKAAVLIVLCAFAAMILVLGGKNLYDVNEGGNRMDELLHSTIQQIDPLLTTNREIQESRTYQAFYHRNHLLEQLGEPVTTQLDSLAQAEKHYRQAEAAFALFRAASAEDTLRAEESRRLETTLTNYLAAAREIMAGMQQGNFQIYLTGEAKQRRDSNLAEFTQASGNFISAMEKDVQSQAAAYQETEKYTNLVTVVLMIVGCLVALVGGLFIRRKVLMPLGEAGQVLDLVADGDLTGRVEVKSTNEIGRMMEALRKMQDSLARMVAQVRTGVNEIHTGAHEISAGNTDLSSRTEQQAASLEESAASMEQLASTVQQNADNARQADQLANGSMSVARKGGETVEEVVQTMRQISESSKRIAEIVGVIDGIAFQTNILALNAAVEAARAGDQGKGVAVVAGEVRSLAQKSAQAAKEIKGLIGDSVAKVDAGSEQVAKAGATMKEIVESVKRVTDIMGEISAASQEQSSGIEQVNQAVTQLDQVTQQNAALVEQSAAAAGSLEEQATRLQEAVSQFKLPGGEVIDVAAQHVSVPSSAVRKKTTPPVSGHPLRTAETHA